jgi:hypothetical protein
MEVSTDGLLTGRLALGDAAGRAIFPTGGKQPASTALRLAFLSYQLPAQLTQMRWKAAAADPLPRRAHYPARPAQP